MSAQESAAILTSVVDASCDRSCFRVIKFAERAIVISNLMMEGDRDDIVTRLARELGAPDILSRIDEALARNELERNSLGALRTIAVNTRRAAEHKLSSVATADRVALTSGLDGTVRGLVQRYRSDQHSPFQKLRFKTRLNYESNLRRVESDHGETLLKDINARVLINWHDAWRAGGKLSMAHSLIGMVRMLVAFGASVLEDRECERLSGVLNKMRFKMPKPRVERITRDQVDRIRREAHRIGVPSIALAQALQFECNLAQKDVIGEWVPVASEPGEPDIFDQPTGMKWVRGIRWSEIHDLVLRHTAARDERRLEIDLRKCPMVMEELTRISHIGMPSFGPVIVSEATGKPYFPHLFRRTWRRIADNVGLPKEMKNSFSRARQGTGDHSYEEEEEEYEAEGEEEETEER